MRAVAIALSLALPSTLPWAAAMAQEPGQEPAAPAKQQPAPAAQPEAVDLGPAAERLEAGGEAGVEGVGAVPPSGAALPTPDTYTVRPGDTLWDLSGRFLNNPWYWPKIWSYNPEISNPHWISPGNTVRFFPATDEAPARIEPVAPQDAAGGGAAAAAGAPPEEDLVAPKELEDFTLADRTKEQDFGEADDVAVVGPYKIGYVPPKGTLGRRDTFITVRELEEAGEIHASFEDKLYLTLHDKVYARFRDPEAVKVGRSYAIFRTTRAVEHPRTGERVGYQTTIVGSARAVASDNKATTLVVTHASEAIERGDRLSPSVEKTLKMVPRRPNQRRVNGAILSTEHEATWLAAEQHMVFVDKGRADGVEEGNVFTVTRAGDPYGHEISADNMAIPENRALPREDIGELLVVDAKERFSTALVVKSLRELFAGDRVQMRTAGAVASGGGAAEPAAPADARAAAAAATALETAEADAEAEAYENQPYSRFALGARLGYGFALGEAAKAVDQTKFTKGSIPAQVEAEFRITRQLALGLYFQYGYAFGSADLCGDSFGVVLPAGVTCSASSARVLRYGLLASYRFPSRRSTPWVGLGAGLESASISVKLSGPGGDATATFKPSGVEYLSMQGGVDYPISQGLTIGPFATLTFSKYTSSTIEVSGLGNVASGSIPSDQRALHEWLILGVKGAFNF